MVAFDTTILLPLLSAELKKLPLDPATGKPVERFKDRLDFLFEQLEENRTKILIATPSLAEILVHTGAAGPNMLEALQKAAPFKIVPFDERAAVEVAMMVRKAIEKGDKRGGSSKTWAQVQFDRQIVATAKVNGATTLYTDDHKCAAFAERTGLRVISIAELPLRPQEAQMSLSLAPSANKQKSKDG